MISRRIRYLLFSGLFLIAVSGLSVSYQGYDEEVPGFVNTSGPRMVFVEDITATWCGYCPAASEGLRDLSRSRDDFRFITLVDDRVEDANERRLEYKPEGFPTVMFDGGFDEQVGSVSSGDEYSDNIDTCLERDTPDVSLEVEVFDMGGSELSIEVVVSNFEGTAYDGILKVMVVEKVSRYLDADGNNYPNSMLSYAIDGEVSLDPGEDRTYNENWVGSEIEDMLGNDFGDIDPENIVIYAALFNAEDNYKPRMTIPPSYYIANYCDLVAEGIPVEMGDAPEVEITSPRDGRTVSGEVSITADVTSDETIDVVEVKIGQDEWEEMTLSGDEYSFQWDTIEVRNGDHRISVKATDDQGLSGIDNIDVTVENEGTPTPPEINSLTHSPIFPDDTQTITIRIDLVLYDTFISSAEAVICIDETCLPPKDMFELSDDSFQIEVGPYEAGEEISYHVELEDTEGNLLSSEEKSFTVQSSSGPDPSDDDTTGDDDDLEGEGTSDSPSPALIMLPLALILVLLAVSRKRDSR